MHGRSFEYCIHVDFGCLDCRMEEWARRFIEIDMDWDVTVCNNRKVIAVWTNAKRNQVNRSIRWKHHLFIIKLSNFKSRKISPALKNQKCVDCHLGHLLPLVASMYVPRSVVVTFLLHFPELMGILKSFDIRKKYPLPVYRISRVSSSSIQKISYAYYYYIEIVRQYWY